MGVKEVATNTAILQIKKSIRWARKNSDPRMTQQNIADHLGITVETYAKYERPGLCAPMNLTTLIEIAQILNVPVSVFFASDNAEKHVAAAREVSRYLKEMSVDLDTVSTKLENYVGKYSHIKKH